MLRKVLLTTVLLMFLAPAALAGGQLDQEIPQQTIAHVTRDHDDEGMSNEVLAALIAGGLAFAGATLTAIVSINSRRRRKG